MSEDQPQSRQSNREEFSRALARALMTANTTQKELSERLRGRVAQSTISEWVRGKTEPASPALTFEIEQVLGVKPGALSAYLGYLPVSASSSLEAALLQAGDIDDRMRAVLLAVVREIERQSDS